MKRIKIFTSAALLLFLVSSFAFASTYSLEMLNGSWAGDLQKTMATGTVNLKGKQELKLPTLHFNLQSNNLSILWPEAPNYNKEVHITVMDQAEDKITFEAYGRTSTATFIDKNTIKLTEGEFGEEIVFSRQ